MLKGLKTELSRGPAAPLLGIYQKDKKPLRDLHPFVIAALCLMAKKCQAWWHTL